MLALGGEDKYKERWGQGTYYRRVGVKKRHRERARGFIRPSISQASHLDRPPSSITVYPLILNIGLTAKTLSHRSCTLIKVFKIRERVLARSPPHLPHRGSLRKWWIEEIVSGHSD